jgi:hypothetical protein
MYQGSRINKYVLEDIHRRSITVAHQRLAVAERRQDKTRRFEVFTAMTRKNGVFWDVTPCGS